MLARCDRAARRSQGGVLVGSELGLVEIEQEVQTQDGIANADLTTLASLSAADGILLG